jgi:hypothetical protein
MKMANPLQALLKKKFVDKPELLKEYFENPEVVPTINDVVSVTPEERDYYTEMKRLYAIKDPKTGQRYDIPLLNDFSPDYFFKYCNYMRTLENDPKTFDKIIGWE